MLVPKELDVFKTAGREASHLSLPFPNPETWMPGQLPITAPKPKAVVQLQTPKPPRAEPSVGFQHKPRAACGKASKILQAQGWEGFRAELSHTNDPTAGSGRQRQPPDLASAA